MSLLHAAAEAGDLNALRTLIEQGASIDDCQDHGWFTGPALHVALRYHKPDCVKFLLEQGADRTFVDSRGWSALLGIMGQPQ